jgi:DNA-binding transcriptional LysR family regulator
MNLRQIEVFRSVMVARSISGAAKALHVSQPAVSRLIAYTEQRVGLPLFERIKGRLYPTPEAQRLFVEVAAVYASVQRVNQMATELLNHGAGVLHLGCSANLSQSLVPAAISVFTRTNPEMRVVLQTMSPQDLVQSLLDRRVELGVAYMPFSHPSLSADLLYENHIVVALPAGHHLAEKQEVHVEDLLGEAFIGYESDIPFAQLVQRCFEHLEQVPMPRVEVRLAHVACALVAAGAGVALVDEQTVRTQHWPNLVTRPLVPNVPTPVHAFHLLYEPLSKSGQAFIDILRGQAIEWSSASSESG